MAALILVLIPIGFAPCLDAPDPAALLQGGAEAGERGGVVHRGGELCRPGRIWVARGSHARAAQPRVAAAQHHGDTLVGMGIGRADADAAASPSAPQNLAGWHQPDGLQYV